MLNQAMTAQARILLGNIPQIIAEVLGERGLQRGTVTVIAANAGATFQEREPLPEGPPDAQHPSEDEDSRDDPHLGPPLTQYESDQLNRARNIYNRTTLARENAEWEASRKPRRQERRQQRQQERRMQERTIGRRGNYTGQTIEERALAQPASSSAPPLDDGWGD